MILLSTVFFSSIWMAMSCVEFCKPSIDGLTVQDVKGFDGLSMQTGKVTRRTGEPPKTRPICATVQPSSKKAHPEKAPKPSTKQRPKANTPQAKLQSSKPSTFLGPKLTKDSAKQLRHPNRKPHLRLPCGKTGRWFAGVRSGGAERYPAESGSNCRMCRRSRHGKKKRFEGVFFCFWVFFLFLRGVSI